MLFLVATPIGHLGDLTFRAVETLKSVDLILCEDTRHSLKLLQHYQISKPLKSYHKFNQKSQEEWLIQELLNERHIALISDAGTPGIADPGAQLVRLCQEHGIPVTAIPGPCAIIQALCLSGLSTDRFQFSGFLPRREEELKRILREILSYEGTTICFESPLRLSNVLEIVASLDPVRELVIARELTKKFEEIKKGSASFLLDNCRAVPIKGEVVLLFSPPSNEMKSQWILWTPEEHVSWLDTTYKMSRQEAIKMAAQQRGVPKREVYNRLLT